MSDDRAADSQRGAATVLLIAMLTLAVVVSAAGLGISRIAVARVRVSSAADLAALAAAQDLDCRRAQSVALANGGRLLACEVQGADVEVTVGLDISMAGRTVQLAARARAGPP